MINAFLNLGFTTQMRYKFEILLQLANVCVILILFYYLSETVGTIELLQGEYFPFILLGLSYQFLYSGLVTCSTSKLLEFKQIGVLESILATRAPSLFLFLSLGSYEIFYACMRSLVLLVIGFVLFIKTSPHIDLLWLGLTLVLTVLVCLSFSALGIASILVWKRTNITAYFNSLWLAMMSEIYFPIRVLPVWLQKVCVLNPFYLGSKLYRFSLGEVIINFDPANAAVQLLIWSLILISLSLAIFKYALRRAYLRGTVCHI